MRLEIIIFLSQLFFSFLRLLDWTLKHVLFSFVLLIRSFSNTLHKRDLFIFVLEMTCSAVLCGCFICLLRNELTRRTKPVDTTSFVFGDDDLDIVEAHLSESESGIASLCTDDSPPTIHDSTFAGIAWGNYDKFRPSTKSLVVIPTLLIPRSLTSLYRGVENDAEANSYGIQDEHRVLGLQNRSEAAV
ncbi:hypothetical protein FB446DRAFT_720258 [Lentinula raphanica]|nr:hypothetical protein FB446DRAFT_720258 [Lentinula raphanica]